MPKCYCCSKKEGHDVFYPPDMVDEPEKSGEWEGKRLCHFCKKGADRLVGTNGQFFDKQAVIKDYQEFCEQTYKNPNIFKAYQKQMVETSVKRAKEKAGKL